MHVVAWSHTLRFSCQFESCRVNWRVNTWSRSRSKRLITYCSAGIEESVIKMAFASRKKPRRNMSITSSEFEFVHRTSPVEPEGGKEEIEGEVGREDSVGGEVEGGADFEVLQEGYLNMSVRVEEEGEDRSGTMARTLRSLRSTGSFSRVSHYNMFSSPVAEMLCLALTCMSDSPQPA